MTVALILSGFLVGILVGTSRMGGSAIMAPILLFAFGIRPSLVVGTDLFYSFITKIFGTVRHYRQQNVNLSVVFYLALGSIPSSLLGVTLIKQLSHRDGSYSDLWIRKVLGIVLILASLFMVIRLIFPRRVQEKTLADLSLQKRDKRSLVAAGIIVGFLVGFTSVGSGTFLIPFLSFLLPLPARIIVGTDILHAAMLTGTSGLAHLGIGNVDIKIVANLLLGSIPGVIIGSRLTLGIPENALRSFIAIVILVSGIMMI